MNIRIGTADYSYPARVGSFYPRRTAQEKLLPYYATHFPLVEIHSSFHRPPLASAAARTFRPSPCDSY